LDLDKRDHDLGVHDSRFSDQRSLFSFSGAVSQVQSLRNNPLTNRSARLPINRDDIFQSKNVGTTGLPLIGRSPFSRLGNLQALRIHSPEIIFQHLTKILTLWSESMFIPPPISIGLDIFAQGVQDYASIVREK
jgi:hypothetical protein